jgi:hypothetical protein
MIMGKEKLKLPIEKHWETKFSSHLGMENLGAGGANKNLKKMCQEELQQYYNGIKFICKL